MHDVPESHVMLIDQTEQIICSQFLQFLLVGDWGGDWGWGDA